MEHFISSDKDFYYFDKAIPPVLNIKRGDVVVFETLDACYGQVHSIEDFMAYRKKPSRGGNPLTGPVYVEGAEPGQTLVAKIESIELSTAGFQLIGPDRAMVDNEVPDWTCWTVKPDGKGYVVLSDRLKFKADPVLGTFGNAPAGVPTNDPNRLGGNCDCPAVKTGTTLYIPVETPGALFGLGDVHALQGDGEVVGAPEIPARVKVSFGLKEEKHAEWVMAEDADNWHSITTGVNEYEAIKAAVFQNAGFIAKMHNIEFKEALVVLTMLGRISIARSGKWGNLTPVVCASFDKNTLKGAIIR